MLRDLYASIPLIFTLSLITASCSGTRPPDLGVRDGKLLPCPASPNCVSSQSGDEGHAVDPLRYTSSGAAAMARLKDIISRMKRAKIVTESPGYLHVEFTSFLFRFVDDVEFYADDAAKIIHVRSASRLGYSDLGVNRRRVESLRAAWNESPATAR